MNAFTRWLQAFVLYVHVVPNIFFDCLQGSVHQILALCDLVSQCLCVRSGLVHGVVTPTIGCSYSNHRDGLEV